MISTKTIQTDLLTCSGCLNVIEEEIMTTCVNYIYMLLISTLLPMVIVASNHPYLLPVKKGIGGREGGGLGIRLGYGFFENRLNSWETQQTLWSKKFLAKREAKPHSAPYVVSIQLMTPEDGLVHYCAGTIINEHWILTAAHCLNNPQMVATSVIVAGCHDIHDRNESQSVQLRQIDYYVRHELFLGGVNPYDIALIYTKEALVFNKFIQPVNLPEQNDLPEGYGTLYGWGNVSMTIVPKYPHKLQQANMPLLDWALCEQVLAASGMQLHETNLCTGPLTGGVSICTADSGGPLIQTSLDVRGQEKQTILGIVSWGKMPCGQKNAPSVFVRVSAFTDWIQQIITTATHIE